MNILVSIIIPTYKGSNKLSRAIDSVLNQTYKNIEIIVVDDNGDESIDCKKTQSVINKYDDCRITYIKHKKNSNGAVARNTGLKKCTGEYITFLDDDDFMFPKRIEKMLDLISKNNQYKAIYSSVILVNNNKIVGQVVADKVLTDKDILLNEMAIGTGSNIFIHRSILDKINGFDEKFIRHQDLEFMIRVCEHTSILNIDEFLVVKATNGTNNIPNYTKMKSTKNMYYSKFQQNIMSLNKDEINKFYIKNNQDLYIASILSNNLKNVKEAKLELAKYKKITIKETLLYYIVKIRMFQILIVLKKLLNKIRLSKDIIRNLDISSDDIKFIKTSL